MKRILASVIDHKYTDFTPEMLAENFGRMREAIASGELEFINPEDRTIWQFVERFRAANDEAPTIATVKEQFHSDEFLEHYVRCQELEEVGEQRPAIGDRPAKKCDLVVRSNFKHVLDKMVEAQRTDRAHAALITARDILVKGAEVDGKKLNGLADAWAYIEDAKKKTAPKKKGSNRLTADQIFQELPPIPWLCEGLRIAPGGVCKLDGYGFSGKSMLAHYLALCIAAGVPAFGTMPVRPGRVLHLDYEQGMRLTQTRYQKLGKGLGLTAEKLRGNLETEIYPVERLDSKNAEDEIRTLVEGFDFVIFDSFRAAAPEIDENSSKARIPLDMLNRIFDTTGAVPLVIHHEGKTTETTIGRSSKMKGRGSSAIFDAVTTNFSMTGERGKPIIMEHTKCRHTGVLLPIFGLTFEDREDGAVVARYLSPEELEDQGKVAKQEKARNLQSELVGFLQRQPGATFTGNKEDLRQRLGANNTELTAALGELQSSGRVLRTYEEGAVHWILTSEANVIRLPLNGLSTHDHDDEMRNAV
jgi:hypothetical protein